MAAAVGPNLTYVKVFQKENGWTYYLAKDAVSNSLIGDYEIIEELSGSDMIGWVYQGPFDELPAVNDAFDEGDYRHRIIPWKEVGASEGTGIVHIAPGCGAEDFYLSREHQLPVIAPLDENGIYITGFDWLTGQSAMDVGPAIFENLQEKGFYYRKQRYPHRYPHCWRCGEELVYRLVDEWFINTGPLYDKPRSEVTEEEKANSYRYQIMDIVDQVNWVPSFGYDREMDWLRNMHDWMISKKRYYGLAIPIWVCDDPECGHFHVIGSEIELKERAVEGWELFDGHAPHRPHIDYVKIACPQCGGIASRIRDVGNPWLDAGIVAYSTLHYREDPSYWEQWFPVDFVTESFPGQFRNWFYSLLAQSTALTGRAPFLNLFSYASLYAEDGREMHKSWGNAIEFNEAADNMGADTMRWLFMSHRPEQNLHFGYGLGDESRRRFLIPFWNVYSFLVTYANLDGWPAEDNGQEAAESPIRGNAQLDRWILTRLDEVILSVTRQLEAFRADKAANELESLLDDVSNWYVRRSRRRFWKSEADSDKAAAYSSLYRVVLGMAKLLAPFIPFMAESIYQNLVRKNDPAAPISIHHTDWPAAEKATLDMDLLKKMRLAINVAGLGRSARGAANYKLRQPLASARIHVGSERQKKDLLDLAEILTEEINVKKIDVVSEVGELVRYKLLPNNRLLGPKYGPLFPEVRDRLTELDPAEAARTLQTDESIFLEVDGQQIELSAEEILIQTESRGGLAVASDKGITVAVDTKLTPELIREGYARDLVRTINAMRKDAGFALDDRITITYEAGGILLEAMELFGNYIRQETLALSSSAGVFPEGAYVRDFEIDQHQISIAIKKH